VRRFKQISYKQVLKTSCCCQNSADDYAVGGTNSSSLPIKSNEGLGRDERVQAFACKQPTIPHSCLEQSMTGYSARKLAYRYQKTRQCRYMQAILFEVFLCLHALS
jgi:hypothetical protein